MKEYLYKGAVMEFDRCIERKWQASTIASSEARAKSNLTYRYKYENNKARSAKITLPDKLILVREV